MFLLSVSQNLSSRSSKRIEARGKAYSFKHRRKHSKFFKSLNKSSHKLHYLSFGLNYSQAKHKLKKHNPFLSRFFLL